MPELQLKLLEDCKSVKVVRLKKVGDLAQPWSKT